MQKKFLLLAAVAAVTVVGPVTQAHALYECSAVARALFGKGPKLPGTWATANGYTASQACGKARYRCEDRLDYKRRADGFPYPVAVCKSGRAEPIYVIGPFSDRGRRY